MCRVAYVAEWAGLTATRRFEWSLVSEFALLVGALPWCLIDFRYVSIWFRRCQIKNEAEGTIDNIYVHMIYFSGEIGTNLPKIIVVPVCKHNKFVFASVALENNNQATTAKCPLPIWPVVFAHTHTRTRTRTQKTSMIVWCSELWTSRHGAQTQVRSRFGNAANPASQPQSPLECSRNVP